jgi:hypothetical protein
VRSKALTAHLASPVRAAVRMLARRRVPRGGALHLHESPDGALRDFTRRLPPRGGAVRDLSPEFLDWRYAQHPHLQFTFATLRCSGEVRGFLVFEDHTLDGTCSIYDLAGASAEDLNAMLALLVLRGLSTPGLVTIRALLDVRHPSRAQLRSLGFIARTANAPFQVHSRDGSAERLAWHLSQGDKDI